MMCDLDTLRMQCWTESIHCFLTSDIFDQRAKKYGLYLRRLTFMGVLVPVLVGVSATSFGLNSRFTALTLCVATVLGVVQAIVSVWSLAQKWEDDYAYSLESHSANLRLYERYRDFGQSPPKNLDTANRVKELIDTENRFRSALDEKRGISDEEKRMGMCAALRQAQKACAGCSETPTSMNPSSCDVCGNFNTKRR